MNSDSDLTSPHRLDALASKGRKDDAGKLRYDLVPVRAEEELVRVLTFGAQKYGAWNWIDVPNSESRYLAAARRHIAAWQRGETRDDESGAHSLAHAACCLMFLLEMELMESDHA